MDNLYLEFICPKLTLDFIVDFFDHDLGRLGIYVDDHGLDTIVAQDWQYLNNICIYHL